MKRIHESSVRLGHKIWTGTWFTDDGITASYSYGHNVLIISYPRRVVKVTARQDIGCELQMNLPQENWKR